MAEEKLTLYQLEGQFQEALNLSDEDEELFMDTLDSNGFFENMEEKFDGYGFFMKDLKVRREVEKAKADIIKKAYDDQMKKVKSYVIKEKFVKNKLYEFMKMTKQEKVKTGNHTFWYQKSAPKLEITNKPLIPKAYYSEQLDEKKLSDSLKAGNVILGAELVKSESLRFR
ncbi:MAG: siphovirus Gp157 family protein [Enterococcaceae bacterium]|nr:siphovirus Gp157 family protein [Enterococcaceae bacterium]